MSLTILDEHYNNMKALDALNQELFQMRMADKETSVRLGCLPSLQTLTNTGSIHPRPFSPRSHSRTEESSFLWQDFLNDWRQRWPTSRWDLRWEHIQITLGPPGRLKRRIWLSCLKAPGPKQQTVHPNPGPLASFPWGNWRVVSHSLRNLPYAWHNWKKKTPMMVRIQKATTLMEFMGVTEEFMVQLARAVKDAQMDERHCYHCSSPEHFIRNCPLMRTARDKKQLNGKEGMVMAKGAWTPPKAMNAVKSPREGGSGGIGSSPQAPFLNPDPFQWWYGMENIAKVKNKWGKLHGPPRQQGAGEYYYTWGM